MGSSYEKVFLLVSDWNRIKSLDRNLLGLLIYTPHVKTCTRIVKALEGKLLSKRKYS